jgi:hypothetical protein
MLQRLKKPGSDTKARISVEAQPKKPNEPNLTLVFNKHPKRKPNPTSPEARRSPKIRKRQKPTKCNPFQPFQRAARRRGAKLSRQIDA